MNAHIRTRMMHSPWQTGSGLVRLLATMLAVALALSLMGAAAPGAVSPFVGIWRAIDNVDGSLMRATFVGPAGGPFFITWTESYFSFCDGRAGLATGIGRLDPADPNVLRARMRLRCLKTGDTVEWDQEWQYRPAYDVLASHEDAYGVDTIWSRLGKPLVPRLDLLVDYLGDAVEGVYAPGHTVVITVTEDDGVSGKGTAEVVTTVDALWGSEDGFRVGPSEEGPSPFDIQPNYWVFAQVDNGATAKVHIGGITGAIDLDEDVIRGTISAAWFSDEIQVTCMPWGAPGPATEVYAAVVPNGVNEYVCDWDAVVWDIQAGQDVGVGYNGPDRHFVASGFRIPSAHFTVFPEWEAMELWEWPIDASIHLSIEDPDTELSPDFAGDYTVPPADWNTEESFLWIDNLGGYDVKSGDLVTITGEGFTVAHTVRALTVGALDLAENTVSGTAGSDQEPVYVWPHEFGGWPAGTHADPVGGNWTADLDDLGGYDLVQSTTGRAEIVDAIGNTTGIDWAVPRIAVYPDSEFVIGWDWRPHGADVHLTIDDPTNEEDIDFGQYAKVEPTPFNPDFWWVKFDFAGEYDVKPGDIVSVTDGTTTREHEVLPLTVSAVDGDADTVTGTSAPEAWVYVHPWDASFDPIQADGDGNWLMNFTDLYDLKPGETNGVSEVFEDDGDSTAMDWYVRKAPTRIWIGAFDYILPETWQPGEHSYRIAWQFTDPGPGGSDPGALTSFIVAENAQPYPGFVLLRGGRLRAREGESCYKVQPIEPEILPAVRLDQPTRFLFGWATDSLMTYAEAQAHFGSFAVWAYWDEGRDSSGSARLELDSASPTDRYWPSYECSFTLLPPE